MSYVFPARDATNQTPFVLDQQTLAEKIGALLQPYQFHTAVCGGAHIGILPRIFAGWFQTVLAFEPDHENFLCLLQNLNNISGVKACEAALTHKHGTARMTPGNQSQHPHLTSSPHGLGVDTLPLDSIGLVACDLLQLDVNGCELLALEGAVDTIYKHRPLIVVEVNDSATRMGHTLNDVDEWMAKRGYYNRMELTPMNYAYHYKET